jgi:hypothetical protein
MINPNSAIRNEHLAAASAKPARTLLIVEDDLLFLHPSHVRWKPRFRGDDSRVGG